MSNDSLIQNPPHPDPLPNPPPQREREKQKAFPKKLIFTAIKYAITLLVIVYVAIALRKNLKDISWHNFHPRPTYLLAAAGCIALVTITQIIAYRLLLEAYGPTLTWPQAATLSWVPGLTKYVPGKVLAIGSTVALLKRYKILIAIALSVTLMGDALAVLTGLIVGAPMLASPEVQEHLRGGWIWCGLLIIAALICMYPPIFAKLVNFALRKLKRAELNQVPKLRYYLLPVLAGFAQWACWGSALWCTARAISGDVTPAQWPQFVVIAALTNTIAYLAFFTPGGVGVREWLLLFGLVPLIGNANAAIVPIALRVLQTIVEIVLCGVGVGILKADSSRKGSGVNQRFPTA